MLNAEQKGRHNRKYANESLHRFTQVNVTENSSNTSYFFGLILCHFWLVLVKPDLNLATWGFIFLLNVFIVN